MTAAATRDDGPPAPESVVAPPQGIQGLASPQGFGRPRRLRKTLEFRAVERRGRRLSGRWFLVIAGAGGSDRLGVTVSKKVGNAVERNRVKRRIREIFRRAACPPAAGVDVVVIARPGAATASFEDCRRELERLWRDPGPGRTRSSP